MPYREIRFKFCARAKKLFPITEVSETIKVGSICVCERESVLLNSHAPSAPPPRWLRRVYRRVRYPAMAGSNQLSPPMYRERDFFIDNLLVRIITEMIKRTGLAPWEFEYLFPGSRISTFQGVHTLPGSLNSRMGDSPNQEIATLQTCSVSFGAVATAAWMLGTVLWRSEPLHPQSLFRRSFKPLALNAKPKTLNPKPGPTMTRKRRGYHSRP